MVAVFTSGEVIATEAELARLLREAAAAPRLAVDVEASGMFAYRARPCTLQFAWSGAASIAVVDALSVSVALLVVLLGETGPVKIVHDVAFDARLLAEQHVILGNVHDTAIAAHMLGRNATGLASLLGSELGLHIDKTMQHHDWRKRPLDDGMLHYLTEDVAHLEALESKLGRAREAEHRGSGHRGDELPHPQRETGHRCPLSLRPHTFESKESSDCPARLSPHSAESPSFASARPSVSMCRPNTS